jgi:hypothetical protein
MLEWINHDLLFILKSILMKIKFDTVMVNISPILTKWKITSRMEHTKSRQVHTTELCDCAPLFVDHLCIHHRHLIQHLLVHLELIQQVLLQCSYYELFMSLMKLSRYTTNVELSRLFALSEASVKYIAYTWIDPTSIVTVFLLS